MLICFLRFTIHTQGWKNEGKRDEWTPKSKADDNDLFIFVAGGGGGSRIWRTTNDKLQKNQIYCQQFFVQTFGWAGQFLRGEKE